MLLIMGSCMSKDVHGTSCIICFNEANTVLYPCGHFCLCQECAEVLAEQCESHLQNFHLNFQQRRGMRCPICRRKGLPAIVYQNIDP